MSRTTYKPVLTILWDALCAIVDLVINSFLKDRFIHLLFHKVIGQTAAL